MHRVYSSFSPCFSLLSAMCFLVCRHTTADCTALLSLLCLCTCFCIRNYANKVRIHSPKESVVSSPETSSSSHSPHSPPSLFLCIGQLCCSCKIAPWTLTNSAPTLTLLIILWYTYIHSTDQLTNPKKPF